jgi:hypothetical protein
MKWLIPVAVVLVALIGVVLGLWKIDTFGLIFMATGSYVILRPGLWLFLGVALIGFGVALWFDWISISGVI